MAEANKPQASEKPTPDAGQRQPEQATPAEQWGQRRAVGEEIKSGGKKGEGSRGRQER